MATISGVVRKVRWSVAQRGLLGTLRFALGRLRSVDDGKPKIHPFDQRFGVETSGLIGGAELATGHAHDLYNTAYYGMCPSRFEGAIELWKALRPEAPVETYTFVDVGCGKGRAVLMASALHFREVVGVELNPELARVAEENVRVWKAAGRGVSPVRVVCADATEVDLPEGPCLLYLFNPFARPVMERFLERIAASFGDRAGLLDIIYFNPESAEAFTAERGFRLIWSGTVPMSEEDAAADLVASPDDLCHLYRWVL